MELTGKIVVVTGGGNGIGRALCHAFAGAGAKAVIVADVNAEAGARVAREIGGLAVATNVAREGEVTRLVNQVIRNYGFIDLFCSNAGLGVDGGFEAPDAHWQRSWEVNVMGHVYAARAVLPAMLARGGGYLLHTVSAAGLLSQHGSAPYSVTKHAALAFAEWISITYGDQGIKVSALCPMGVRTDMLFKAEFGGGSFLLDTAIEPEQVAQETLKGLAEGRFLILPHPDVAEFFRRKASDYDRWLRGMRRLQATTQPLKAKLSNDADARSSQ